MTKPIGVLIADDHPLVRAGLRAVVESAPDIVVVGEAASGDEKIMANWVPKAIKEGACSWLLNLPVGSVSFWEEMRGCG